MQNSSGRQTAQKTALNASNLSFKSGKDTQKSYGIPTIALLNPQLYKEMSKADRQVKDPIATSLKNIKERHTYLENRQQRIDKRNSEIARDLKAREDEKIKQGRLQMLGK